MIYLVSNQTRLYESDRYKYLDKEKALDMIMSAGEMVEFDTETEGLDPYTKALLCSQFGIGEDQIVVDNTSIPIDYFKPVFEKKVLLGWNLAFDLKFLYHHRIVPARVWDGMIAEKLLYLGYPAQFHSLSLQSAALQYLNLDLDKSIRGKICSTGLTEDVIVYAAHDVTYLTSIKEKQLIELEKKDLIKAIEFENQFVPVLAYIEYCGAKLDVSKWKEKMKSDKDNLQKSEDALNAWVEDYYDKHKDPEKEFYVQSKLVIPDIRKEMKMTDSIPPNAINVKRKTSPEGEITYTYSVPFNYVSTNLQGDLFAGFDTAPKCHINWSSPKQTVPLFELLGLNCTIIDKKTKLKKKSVDIKVIAPQAAKCDIVPLYVDYKQWKIQVDTFGEKFLKNINPVTGRIHASFYQLGCDTGRLSSSDPNLQNLPSDEVTRACFVSEKGFKWISADYKGQESFLMASIANDKAMLDELVNGSGDMHSLTAKMVFREIPRDMPLKQIKSEYHHLRQEAKGYEFCFNYGGDWNTLMKNYGLNRNRAKEIYNNYMSGFSGLKQYQDIRRRDVVDKGYILLNPITKHKAFIYDWDHLNEINDAIDSEEGQYAMNHLYDDPTHPLVQEINFLKRRIADSEKQSINYPIQHAGSMCFKVSAIMFFRWLIKNNLLFTVKYCIPVHDEHNVEAPEEIADKVSKVLVKCMEEGGKRFCTRAHLGADVNISDHWIH